MESSRFDFVDHAPDFGLALGFRQVPAPPARAVTRVQEISVAPSSLADV
jgi:hypothetical protein